MDDELRRDFNEFVAARSAALFRTAMALTGHRQQAEDLLQEALASAVRHWKDIHSGNPEAYLRRAIFHHHVSWWRRRWRRMEVLTDTVPERATRTEATGRVDTQLTLRAAMDKLPPRQRAVLVLRYFDDLPDGQIAALLGCKESTVRSQALRALVKLRALCPEFEAPTIQEVWQ